MVFYVDRPEDGVGGGQSVQVPTRDHHDPVLFHHDLRAHRGQGGHNGDGDGDDCNGKTCAVHRPNQIDPPGGPLEVGG